MLPESTARGYDQGHAGERAVPCGRRGIERALLACPDEVHGFLRHQSWRRAFEAAAILEWKPARWQRTRPARVFGYS